MLSRPDHLKKLHTLLAREEERNGFVNCRQKLHNRHPTQHISRPARTGAFTSRGVEIQSHNINWAYCTKLSQQRTPSSPHHWPSSCTRKFFQCARQKVRRKKALPETAEATVPPSLYDSYRSCQMSWLASPRLSITQSQVCPMRAPERAGAHLASQNRNLGALPKMVDFLISR